MGTRNYKFSFDLARWSSPFKNRSQRWKPTGVIHWRGKTPSSRETIGELFRYRDGLCHRGQSSALKQVFDHCIRWYALTNVAFIRVTPCTVWGIEFCRRSVAVGSACSATLSDLPSHIFTLAIVVALQNEGDDLIQAIKTVRISWFGGEYAHFPFGCTLWHEFLNFIRSHWAKVVYFHGKSIEVMFDFVISERKCFLKSLTPIFNTFTTF